MRVDVAKTAINLAGRAHFGGVRVRKSSLEVGFLLPHAVHDPRIARREAIGGTKIGHLVHVKALEYVDSQLLSWLTEAFAQQG